MNRAPVGYDASLLNDYVPGATWYLPASVRAGLHELGRTPDAERPAGTYAREIFGRLLIDLAWASSRLEGNTYSRLDTRNLIEFGQQAEGRDATEAQMILNHKEAIEFLVEEAGGVGFNRHTFTNLHALLSDNLMSDPQDEGRLRTKLVSITGTVFQPLAIPQKIDDWFELILAKAGQIPDPFEQSFFVMVHLPYLQPFADVNKRTSRLGANLSLIQQNLCPLSFIDVPDLAYVEATLAVYELRRVDLLRDVYVWAYERSCAQYRVVREALGEPDLFRLRHQVLLREAVREIVLTGAAPREDTMREWAALKGVPPGEVAHFARMGLELLVSLHEGALVRYRLRTAEFRAWKARFTPAGSS